MDRNRPKNLTIPWNRLEQIENLSISWNGMEQTEKHSWNVTEKLHYLLFNGTEQTVPVHV